MADNAAKAVESALLDTWSRGPSAAGLLTDLGAVMRGGDSVDVPYKTALTVNTSETASPAATSLSVDALTVNRPKFLNQGITVSQYDLLMNGNGSFAAQLTRGAVGDLVNAVDRDIVEYLISLAYDTSATYHVNVAGDAVTDTDVGDCEAALREQDGVGGNMGLAWLVSPRAAASIKASTDYIPQDLQTRGDLGLPIIASLNGIPVFQHSAVPGGVDSLRQQVATSAVTVASNVATATVASGHGFVPGQKIWTSGLTTNVAKASAVAITSVTATEIVYPLTASNGSLADGVGTIYSASSMAFLMYAPWLFYSDTGAPRPQLVPRTDAAGWALKLSQYIGRIGHTGAVRVLHAPGT